MSILPLLISLTWLLASWLFGWHWLTPVLAQESLPETLFEARFDSVQDIQDWTVQRNQQYWNAAAHCMYGSQPAPWSIIDGRLGITIHGPSCTTEITPKALDLSDIAAYEIEFDWFFGESIHMDRNMIFAWQDPANWYGIKAIGQSIFIQKVVDGKSFFLSGDSAQFSFQPNQEHHVVVRYTPDKKIQVLVNGAELINAQD